MDGSPRHRGADRPSRRMLALALAAAIAPVAAAAVDAPPDKESSSMPRRLSRIPAPQVAPFEIDGMRCEQVRNGLLAGLDQMGGWLAAVDVASGQQPWVLKVYENHRDPTLEGDAQDVSFRSMVRRSDGTLLIENERRGRFVVDPAARPASPRPEAVRAALHAATRRGHGARIRSTTYPSIS